MQPHPAANRWRWRANLCAPTGRVQELAHPYKGTRTALEQ